MRGATPAAVSQSQYIVDLFVVFGRRRLYSARCKTAEHLACLRGAQVMCRAGPPPPSAVVCSLLSECERAFTGIKAPLGMIWCRRRAVQCASDCPTLCDDAAPWCECHYVRSLGPFHGAIAVPSVTRCRCRCCRRRRRRGRTSMRRRRATVPVATPGEWAWGGSQSRFANGPNIIQMLLVVVN